MKTPKRLVELMQNELENGESKRGLAAKLGINTNGLELYLTGVTEPRRAALERFARYFHVTEDYILGKDNVGTSWLRDFVLVPRYGIQASAGPGSLVDSEGIVDYLSFRRDWIENSLGMKKEDLALVSVSGDSMVPTLQDGDIVLVDMKNQGRFKSDAIYLINGGDELRIKRIQKKTDGTLIIKSDNKLYDPEVIGNLELVRIVGRVVWAGKRL